MQGDASKLPVQAQANIERGCLHIFGKEIPLPIKGKGWVISLACRSLGVRKSCVLQSEEAIYTNGTCVEGVIKPAGFHNPWHNSQLWPAVPSSAKGAR